MKGGKAGHLQRRKQPGVGRSEAGNVLREGEDGHVRSKGPCWQRKPTPVALFPGDPLSDTDTQPLPPQGRGTPAVCSDLPEVSAEGVVDAGHVYFMRLSNAQR